MKFHLSILTGGFALATLPCLGQSTPPDFDKDIRPILSEYCLKCHSTEKQKGDLDLERFASVADAKKDPQTWQDVLDQLASKEMPPKDKPQPSPELKQRLASWTTAMLDEVALATAGDPDPIALRRLSNAEYRYTIRDLTGIPSLDPTREFPIDGAAGEGFDNASAALVMSPALLAKYLDAAKDIASHAVLLPDGIRFSPAKSSRDWTDELLARIRAFYAPYCDSGGATAVNLQGVKFDTNSGGRLPVERYVAALLKHRDALLAGKTTIPNVATVDGLSPKYLALLWQGLTDPHQSPVLDGIRQSFRQSPPGDTRTVVAAVQAWQQYLWRFFSVGHIGKRNGPAGWQQPWNPLATQHELRLKLAAPANSGDVTLYLVASDAGTGHGSVRWDNARLVVKNHEDTLLSDVPGALPADLEVHAPTITAVRIPGLLATDAEFVVTASLPPGSSPEAAVQVRVLTAMPGRLPGLTPGETANSMAKGLWSDNNARTTSTAPILVQDGSPARRRLEKAFDDFRALFPAALCYSKIVPVDEVVTLTLFYREDDQLQRLMLDDAQAAALDRLWSELRFVSQSPLKQVDVFDQLYQFATQDADPSAFEPLREPIRKAAEDFKKQLVATEPAQLQAVIDFARQAWRRPLTQSEQDALRALYHQLRSKDLPHEAALRLTLARVFVSPAFLYRGEMAAPGNQPVPVNDWEIATRLSYFLWSSAPDEELISLAAAGRLHDPEVLAAQARRMLKDARVRRLATEFGCQWLHVRDLDILDEKSERHFPNFVSLRGDMQEEIVRFFTDLFQEDRPVLSLLDADATFVDGPLARFYGIAPPKQEDVWQRADGVRALGRGGVLGFAGTLARQSGASRTSPILRGNWVGEVLLGDKLPRPPKGVPILPEEAPIGLTERQLIERHSTDEKCAKCHQRIDPFGFALEGFDAIGHARTADTTGLTIDTQVRLLDGTSFTGLDGLRTYLLTTRRDDFLRQFTRKLLGYALGRGLQLSDKPLIDSILARLQAHDYHVADAVELIVRSPQFRDVRGRDYLTRN